MASSCRARSPPRDTFEHLFGVLLDSFEHMI